MDIHKNPQISKKTRNKEQSSNLGKSGVAASATANSPRAKAIQTNSNKVQQKHDRTVESKNTDAIKEPTKIVLGYVEEFKSLMDKSLVLLQTHVAARTALLETIKRDKIGLTPEQLAISAALDNKITVCTKRIKLLHTWIETAARTQQVDKLEKICLATSEYVVDVLDKSTKEYTALMLRIFSEDEEIEAQLKELEALDLSGGIEEDTESTEELAIEATENTPQNNIPETSPWSLSEAIWTLIYGAKK